MQKRAVVTGGTGELGRAVALKLSQQEYEVHLSAVDEDEAAKYRGPGIVGVADLTDLASARKWASSIGAPVSGLACLAGGFEMVNLAEAKEGDFDKMFRTNVQTAANALAAFTPLMQGGAAVLVGSQSFEGAKGMSLYAASKAAVVSLARSAALELQSKGIRANSVLPNTIDTPANRAAMPNSDFEKWAKPEEIAEVIAFLFSDAARIVSGNAIRLGRTV